MAEFELGYLLLVLLDLVVCFFVCWVAFFSVCVLSFILYCTMGEKIKGRET